MKKLIEEEEEEDDGGGGKTEGVMSFSLPFPQSNLGPCYWVSS